MPAPWGAPSLSLYQDSRMSIHLSCIVGIKGILLNVDREGFVDFMPWLQVTAVQKCAVSDGLMTRSIDPDCPQSCADAPPLHDRGCHSAAAGPGPCHAHGLDRPRPVAWHAAGCHRMGPQCAGQQACTCRAGQRNHACKQRCRLHFLHACSACRVRDIIDMALPVLQGWGQKMYKVPEQLAALKDTAARSLYHFHIHVFVDPADPEGTLPAWRSFYSLIAETFKHEKWVPSLPAGVVSCSESPAW